MTTLTKSVLTYTMLALTAAFAVACGTEEGPRRVGTEGAAGKASMVVELPKGRSVSGQNSFTCRALMEADITGSFDETLTKGLEGKVSAGVNAVAVEIEGPKTLTFLSQAGFSVGTVRGPSFDILENSQDSLAATFFDGSSVNTFVLNKKNGLAIWSKVRPSFPLYEAPTGAQSYLVCE